MSIFLYSGSRAMHGSASDHEPASTSSLMQRDSCRYISNRVDILSLGSNLLDRRPHSLLLLLANPATQSSPLEV